MEDRVDFVKWASENGYGEVEFPVRLVGVIKQFEAYANAQVEQQDKPMAVVTPEERARKMALKEAVTALWLDDRSDYKRALYTVVEILIGNSDRAITSADIDTLYQQLTNDH